ncbi:hypothetical protein PENARI_c018G09629 [Penicillium arizonense]|uniref:Uncharacterized protein n=1 Tax=Penicillium arizonense TaxID=1835702 RepID=A0A1F5LB57_PENAI|nr:hypothetical protein PENARI_c018G09629 [Penicillium arizonense]OGE50230.1 hypothetical protein PENARI_c018G09629 [Penicillium arizonense]
MSPRVCHAYFLFVYHLYMAELHPLIQSTSPFDFSTMQTNTLIAVLLAVGLAGPAILCLAWFWYARRVRRGFAEGQWISRRNRDRAQNHFDAERGGQIKGPVWIPNYTAEGWCRPKLSDSIPLRSPEYVHLRDQRKGRQNSDQRFEDPNRIVSSPPPKRPNNPYQQQPKPLSKRQQKKLRAQEKKKQQQEGQNQPNNQDHSKGKWSQRDQGKPAQDCHVEPDQGNWGSNKQNNWGSGNHNQSQNKGNRSQRDQQKTTPDWNPEPEQGDWDAKPQSNWANGDENDNHNNQNTEWGHEAKGKKRSNHKQGNGGNNNGNNDGYRSGGSYNNGFVNNTQRQQTTTWFIQTNPRLRGEITEDIMGNTEMVAMDMTMVMAMAITTRGLNTGVQEIHRTTTGKIIKRMKPGGKTTINRATIRDLIEQQHGANRTRAMTGTKMTMRQSRAEWHGAKTKGPQEIGEADTITITAMDGAMMAMIK